MTRIDLINMLPEGSVGAEIGVLEGSFSQQILDTGKVARLYLVDPYIFQPGPYEADPADASQEVQDARYEALVKRFENDPRVEIRRETGVDFFAAADRGFDFVYLDGCHTYKNVLEELQWCNEYALPFILGHDWRNDSEAKRMGFGVVRAVNDFLDTAPYEISHITNQEDWPSYRLERI